jgi:hypothetical protein
VIALLPILAVVLIVFYLVSTSVYDRWQHQHYLTLERKGLCLRSHYDLRASRHTCPECGMIILRR